MKKRLVVLAAGAAIVAGGAVAAIPGGSAHGFNLTQCHQIEKANFEAFIGQGISSLQVFEARNGQFAKAFHAANCP